MRRSNNMFRKHLLLQIVQLAALRYDNPNIRMTQTELGQDTGNWLQIYNKEAADKHFLLNEFFKINFLTAFINHLN